MALATWLDYLLLPLPPVYSPKQPEVKSVVRSCLSYAHNPLLAPISLRGKSMSLWQARTPALPGFPSTPWPYFLLPSPMLVHTCHSSLHDLPQIRQAPWYFRAFTPAVATEWNVCTAPSLTSFSFRSLFKSHLLTSESFPGHSFSVQILLTPLSCFICFFFGLNTAKHAICFTNLVSASLLGCKLPEGRNIHLFCWVLYYLMPKRVSEEKDLISICWVIVTISALPNKLS